ncbi:hypothetical protein IAT38_003640 [Cryptococcus sp. DSM 104549]
MSPPEPDPSPALTDGSLVSVSASAASGVSWDHHAHLPSHLNYDRTLTTALSHLLTHLIQPLAPHYPPATLNSLLDELRAGLTARFSATWDETHPQVGSGSRSLICTRWAGLPGPMRDVGGGVGVEERVWRKAIAKAGGREGRADKGEEWEVWCDPGQVVWRWGGWEWEDPGFEPVKVIREPLQVIWQAATDTDQTSTSPATPAKVAAQASTPARPSHAIPIRAPAVLAIPPTPASNTEAPAVESKSDLLPAFSALGLGHAPGTSGRTQQASGWSSSDAPSSRSTSMAFSDASAEDTEPMRSVSSSFNALAAHSEQAEDEARPSSRGSHRGSESQSSVSSSVSDANSGHTQLLLTPASRPSTADPFGVPLLPIQEDSAVGKATGRGKQPAPTGLVMPRGRAADGQGVLAELESPSTATATAGATPSTPTTETTITPRVPTPTVTPYDGGNVTVLGGGVKLGGGGGSASGGPGSRGSSAHGSHRNPLDRSRSPSISLASRALNTALGPNSGPGGEGRKQRTRRRIMPTYLGHLGQPGVGGPVMGAFGQFAGNVSPGGGMSMGGMGMGGMGYQQHVGVGVAPPPIPRGPMPRMG